MKRPIKFRGLGIDGETYFYGDLYQRRKEVGIHCLEDGGIFEVKPETVAQLVGYDKDGREVYEGDVVVGRDYETEVKLIPNVVLTNFKLKEDSHETTD